MSEGFKNPNMIGMVGVKSTYIGTDAKDRAKYAFHFGISTDKQGNEVNQLQQLVALLAPLAEAGDPVKLEFRVSEVKLDNGRTFPSAFLMVNRPAPRVGTDGGGTDGADRINESIS